MAKVIMTCPTTGVNVPTGHHMTQDQIDAASARYAFRCASCGAIHHWTRGEAHAQVSRLPNG